MENLPVLLVIDDNEALHEFWDLRFKGKVELLSALSIEKGRELFAENLNRIGIIAVDGAVPGSVLNTLPLVKEVRQAFSGPMIAISSDPNSRAEMLKAGCDYEIHKKDLSKKISELIE